MVRREPRPDLPSMRNRTRVLHACRPHLPRPEQSSRPPAERDLFPRARHRPMDRTPSHTSLRPIHHGHENRLPPRHDPRAPTPPHAPPPPLPPLDPDCVPVEGELCTLLAEPFVVDILTCNLSFVEAQEVDLHLYFEFFLYIYPRGMIGQMVSAPVYFQRPRRTEREVSFVLIVLIYRFCSFHS